MKILVAYRVETGWSLRPHRYYPTRVVAPQNGLSGIEFLEKGEYIPIEQRNGTLMVAQSEMGFADLSQDGRATLAWKRTSISKAKAALENQ